MKFFRYVVSVFSIFISSYTSAYVVTDVREFNQIYPPNFERPEMEPDWIYDITDYDFVRGRGIWLGKVTLTLEITPGTTAVTESAPFSLITIGCLALAFARYRNS